MATQTKKVGRDSGTGRFVTEKYVKTHPNTTETQHVPVPAPQRHPKPKGK